MSVPSRDFDDHVVGITALLTARHDGLTVLRAVVGACAAVLGADAVGVLVVDPRGGVEVAAASDERARFVELLQAQLREGPCVDSIRDDAVVAVDDFEGVRGRWPEFAEAALREGYRAVYAFPMRLLGRAVGGVNLLYTVPTRLPERVVRRGQGLADLAVLGLSQERGPRRVERLAERTVAALHDRALVSQAVGVLLAVLSGGPEDARAVLERYSVRTGVPVSEVARALTDGSLDPHAVVERVG
ncbi:GAF and ANTAR domain-containing protein [Actinosynnema sp. NPDC047251]